MNKDSGPVKKRFIAGAACPQCKIIDRLVMYRQEGVDFRECVACGFHDEMRFSSSPRELQTRVNSTEQQKQAETKAVKVLGFDASSPGKSKD
jgi:uncharacterized protein